METKRILTKKIPVQLATATNSRIPFTADLVKNCKELLDSDILVEFGTKEIENERWGLGQEESIDFLYYPFVVVSRQVEETDEEYVERLRSVEQTRIEVERKEKLEYLRLKAKFDIITD